MEWEIAVILCDIIAKRWLCFFIWTKKVNLQKESVDREFYFVESIHNNRIIKDVGYVLL